MSTIYRNRTIRPSSRLETSVSYKIDTLVITINHESENFHKEFTFSGEKVANRSSIHFRYINGEIIWSPVQPD